MTLLIFRNQYPYLPGMKKLTTVLYSQKLIPVQHWYLPATVNQHPPVHHQGWMICDQETVFCWVPVPQLTMVVSAVGLFTPTNQVGTKNSPYLLCITIYIPSSPLFCYLPVYMLNLLLIEWVTKMKPGSNSVEDHPQLSHNRYPVDGALVGAGSLWRYLPTQQPQRCFHLFSHLHTNQLGHFSIDCTFDFGESSWFPLAWNSTAEIAARGATCRS